MMSKTWRVVAAFVFGVAGCKPAPKVDVSVSIEDDEVVFNIQASGINGLLRFRVEDSEANLLWDVDLGYEKGTRIIYGVLPVNGSTPADQVFPPNRRRPSPIRGKRVAVFINYQFDDCFTPSSRYLKKTVIIP